MGIVSPLVLLAAVASVALGGSECPPRSAIYPCICINVGHGRKAAQTIVTCHNLRDDGDFAAALLRLGNLEIDQLHLYDSFLDTEDDARRVFPDDWTSIVKAKEFVVADSNLSNSFACQLRHGCLNSIITSFTVTNSSSSDKIHTVCDTGASSVSSWTGCLKNLRHFRFNYGRLNSLAGDLFPDTMPDLLSLDLSRNQIAKIEPNAFKNLPALVSLDLSHNAIQVIEVAFMGRRMEKLESLDVSWNNIKDIGMNSFVSLPSLKSFNVASNNIETLKESDWRHAPKTLRSIEVSNNPIHCDCGVRFVNSTFAVYVNFEGTCATPSEYENSKVRRASRYLTQRCDAAGVVGSRTNGKSRRKSSTTRRTRP